MYHFICLSIFFQCVIFYYFFNKYNKFKLKFKNEIKIFLTIFFKKIILNGEDDNFLLFFFNFLYNLHINYLNIYMFFFCF